MDGKIKTTHTHTHTRTHTHTQREAHLGGEASLLCLCSVVLYICACSHGPNIVWESYTQRPGHHPAISHGWAATKKKNLLSHAIDLQIMDNEAFLNDVLLGKNDPIGESFLLY